MLLLMPGWGVRYATFGCRMIGLPAAPAAGAVAMCARMLLAGTALIYTAETRSRIAAQHAAAVVDSGPAAPARRAATSARSSAWGNAFQLGVFSAGTAGVWRRR